MALRKRPIAAGIASLLFSGYLSALGLGEIKLNSALNEPLDAEIPLVNLGELGEDDIIAGLASNSDFANAGIDKELILTTLNFRIDMNTPGGPTLRVLSQKPIREPYLDFLVDVQWPTGRLLREYTLLLDLPVYAGGDTSKKKIDQPVAQQRSPATRQPLRGDGYGTSSPPRPQIAAGDEEYEVRHGDTLWGIASSLSSSASIHERMDAILRINPDAFINGDINLLKRGAVLRLPDYGSMHTQLSGRGSESADSSAYAPELSGSAREGRSTAPATNGGRLTLEAGEEGAGGQSTLGTGSGELSGLRGDLSVLEEELDRSRRENSELRQRLASLEEQITTMQRLMEIGSDDLRAIQLSGQAADSAGAADSQTSGLNTGDSAGGPVGDVDPSQQPASAGDLGEDELEVDSPALALFPSASTSSRARTEALGFDAPQVADRDLGDGGISPPGDATGTGLDRAASAPTEVAEAAAQSEESEIVAEQAPQASPATKSMTMDTKSEQKGWFDNVKGILLGLLGIVVVAIAAIAVFVLRRRKGVTQEDRPAARPYTPPPVQVRERNFEKTPEPEAPAASIDDIDLKEEDDLFGGPEAKPAPAAPQPSAAPQAPAPQAKAPPPPVADEQGLEDMELDLSEFDLGETEEAKPGVEFDEGEPRQDVAGDLNLDEEFDFLGDIDEGDTQLELAQAYMEMGDQSGAREILLEVMEGGSDDQKEKARQLLDQMG